MKLDIFGNNNDKVDSANLDSWVLLMSIVYPDKMHLRLEQLAELADASSALISDYTWYRFHNDLYTDYDNYEDDFICNVDLFRDYFFGEA